jgi:hypothetical protein
MVAAGVLPVGVMNPVSIARAAISREVSGCRADLKTWIAAS